MPQSHVAGPGRLGLRPAPPARLASARAAARRPPHRGRPTPAVSYHTSHREGVSEGTDRDSLVAAAASGPGEDVESEPHVVTTLKWPAALGGQQVAVTGTFNDWGPPLPLSRAPQPCGDWVRSVAVAPGSHQYKFVVDGEWVASPCEPAISDGGGTFNNHRLVQPTVTFRWRGSELGGSEVMVAGGWSGWGELLPLVRDPATGDYELACCLPPGSHPYSFLVDGAWALCPHCPTAHTEDGHFANVVEVASPPAYHVFYPTGWPEAVLRVRSVAPGGGAEPAAAWREVPMHDTPSRGRPGGGKWKTAVIPAPLTGAGAAPAALEFYLTDGTGKSEDRPYGGGTYRCEHPGGYKLQRGSLRPFHKATAAPTMVVSDLDGTMVGDGEEADAMTAEFCQYWEENAAMSGSVLVYNTGRSLGQFLGLWESKAGALALPDVLVTAVGTKIFRLDTEGGTRGTASGATWREDLQWARLLDEGWDLAGVKEAAEAVLAARGPEATQWLDRGTEHPHRIALSVRADVLPAVVAALREGIAAAGVAAQIITSGQGGWRYLDVVAAQGGKLAALEYVRTLYGIARGRCVACGDSGNDILMLAGQGPAVVVGNSQPELVDWMLSQPQSPRLVITDAPMARGILEGLARHGLY